MHYQDEQVEIHKVVVGPYDNNVFVVRCRESGEALLIDAANEHEQLLELCQRLGVRKVVETHGHWDHIQAVPQLRDAGYEVAVRAEDAAMLPSYDLLLEDDALGGGGSRGNGRVSFDNLKLTWRGRDYYASGADEREVASGADLAGLRTKVAEVSGELVAA